MCDLLKYEKKVTRADGAPFPVLRFTVPVNVS